MSTITTAWHQIQADVTAAYDYSFAHWWLLVIAAGLVIAVIIADLTGHRPPADSPTGRKPDTDTDQETDQP